MRRTAIPLTTENLKILSEVLDKIKQMNNEFKEEFSPVDPVGYVNDKSNWVKDKVAFLLREEYWEDFKRFCKDMNFDYLSKQEDEDFTDWPYYGNVIMFIHMTKGGGWVGFVFYCDNDEGLSEDDLVIMENCPEFGEYKR